MVIGYWLPAREAVDERYAELTAVPAAQRIQETLQNHRLTSTTREP